MSDIESVNWSETANNNDAATPNGAPEGWAPSSVNEWGREVMAALKRDWNRKNPTVISGGTANAQTLTYSTAPAAYVAGQRFSFMAGALNTGAATLNVNGLGAKAVQLAGAALTGGEIVSGDVAELVYDGTQFQILATPGLLASMRKGKLACTGTITLTASSTTTTPTDALIAANSFIQLMPKTATATTAFAAGIRIVPGAGSATLTHASTADIDKDFAYAVIG